MISFSIPGIFLCQRRRFDFFFLVPIFWELTVVRVRVYMCGWRGPVGKRSRRRGSSPGTRAAGPRWREARSGPEGCGGQHIRALFPLHEQPPKRVVLLSSGPCASCVNYTECSDSSFKFVSTSTACLSRATVAAAVKPTYPFRSPPSGC